MKINTKNFRQNAYAVVIGIDKYQDVKIPNLGLACADAKGIYQVLTDSDLGRISPENIILLLDEKATQRNIRSAIGTKIPRRAGANDMIFIYFAGHGAPVIDPKSGSSDGMEKYLIPADAERDDLRATGISMDEIQKFFGWIECKQVFFFIDSCYSGEAGGRTFSHSQYQRRALLTNEFLDNLAGEGRVVITACDVNEVSLEEQELGHGLFTYYLIEGLKGVADKDRDGLVTVNELYEYIYQNVSNHARKIDGCMHPIQKGAIKGKIFLTQYVYNQIKETNLKSEPSVKIKETNASKIDFFKKALNNYRQRFKKFVKEKPRLILSGIGAVATILAILLEFVIPNLSQQTKPEKYLSLHDVKNIPDSIFVGLCEFYSNDSLLFVELKSNSSKKVQAEMQFEIEIANLSPFISKKVIENDFSGTKIFPLQYPLMQEMLNLNTNHTAQATVNLIYHNLDDMIVTDIRKKSKNITIIHKNYIDFSIKKLLSTFLTLNEPELKRFTHYLYKVLTELDARGFNTSFSENLLKAIGLFHWMKLNEIYLDRDLHAQNINYLQYPVETLSKKVGTSNDLAVLYATLLLTNNIPALVIPLNNHLIVFFNTGISKENYFFFSPYESTNNWLIDERGNIWLPFDMNTFGQSFYDAWFESRNYDLPRNFPKGRIHKQLSSTRIPHQWKFDESSTTNQQVVSQIISEVDVWQDDLKNTLEQIGDEISLQKLAVIYLKAKDVSIAKMYLQKSLTVNQNNAESYYLLGRAYFQEEKYDEAIEYFGKATIIDPLLAKAYFWLACSYKSLGHTTKARNAYDSGKKLDEQLSQKFIICNPDID
ncbi:MAG: caspase family protein [bacterium]